MLPRPFQGRSRGVSKREFLTILLLEFLTHNLAWGILATPGEEPG